MRSGSCRGRCAGSRRSASPRRSGIARSQRSARRSSATARSRGPRRWRSRRAPGIEVNVERRTHLSVITVVGGAACIGPDHGRGSTFVDTREWIGEFKVPDREDSLAELARRYFAAFAPATERDFAKWSGLPLGECRIGMERIARRARAARAVEPGALRPARLQHPGPAQPRGSPASRLRHLPDGLREPRRTPWTRRGRR